jgi:hypothetical protein
VLKFENNNNMYSKIITYENFGMHGSILQEVCDKVIELDNSIRFAGFANNAGKLIAYKYRKGLDPLLRSNESELSFIDSALRMRTRKDMEPKLGRAIYSITLYEKVKRATISFDNEDYAILMISFDNSNKRSDHESLILDRILPLVSHHFTKT